MPASTPIVPCPHCGAAVVWSPESKWRPFCSDRCKTIDVAAWASERYRVPLTQSPDPEESLPDDER